MSEHIYTFGAPGASFEVRAESAAEAVAIANRDWQGDHQAWLPGLREEFRLTIPMLTEQDIADVYDPKERNYV